jgi:hypothetical protein
MPACFTGISIVAKISQVLSLFNSDPSLREEIHMMPRDFLFNILSLLQALILWVTMF